MTENPFLSRADHPPFDQMTVQHLVPGIRQALQRAQRELDELIAETAPRTFENTLMRLDDLVEHLARAFDFARHLTDVRNSAELREAYGEVLPEYSAFMAGLATDARLWGALQEYAATDAAAELDGVRRRHLDKTLQEFRRAGADLPADQRERVLALHVELSQLSNRFSENVLDATDAFEMVLTDASELEGLPESVRRRARADAERRGVAGYRFTLQAPSYGPFLRFAASRERRRELYLAQTGRAAKAPYDNRPVIAEILRKRRELARMLGYRDFADLQLEDRMIESGAAAQAFERQLARRTVPYFRHETQALADFARDDLGIDPLEPWDVAYVSEALRRSRFSFDEEELRPYFRLEDVLNGVFTVAERLFGVQVRPVDGIPTWHPDVQTFEVRGADGELLGSFYADWYPRESKRDGAWMNPMITGGPASMAGEGAQVGAGTFTPHLGVIIANLTPSTDAEAALLTHDEVTTLFHEFGHLLHHLVGRVEIPSRGNIGGIAWDFVELPSQLMENWAWERDGLDLFARHVDTGATIPDDLFTRLSESRTFMGAVQQMRQLAFGTVDLALHIDYDPGLGGDPVAFGEHVMEPFMLRPEFAHNGSLTSFSHVFAGSYAAGYYSYKWSEVLDADVFGRFRHDGIFNAETGRAFLDTVLSRGDSEDPAVLFRKFMGRDPDSDALIHRNLGPEPGFEPSTAS